jgi:nucleotide-binding universal stress UspA family protein
VLTIKHILFPTDFSERCTATAPFVRNLAKTFAAKVTLIGVQAPFWQSAVADPGGAITINLEELRQDLQVRLNGAFTSELSGLEVERETRVGEPGEAIVEFAHSEGVDLIMMPTHGYGPFRALLLGSVTAKVLHDAQCPVWTAAHVENPEVGKHQPVKTVICAFDGTPNTVPVMEWAHELSAATGASLRIVHAVSGVEAWPEGALNRQLEDRLASDARERIEKMLASSWIDAPLCIEPGDPAHVIHAEADKHNADVVVIGRGLLHESLGRLRTQAYGIIRHAPCPVISV